MGVAHHLPGLGLGGLAEVADVLPPTRLLLDPAGLRGEEEEEGGGKAAPPSQSDALGLSRELEAVVLGTDAIRAAPSAFDPPGRSAAEGASHPSVTELLALLPLAALGAPVQGQGDAHVRRGASDRFPCPRPVIGR